MNGLHVPKRCVSIELLACGGERRNVSVFLSEFSPDHAGPERVSDVLGRSETFFPAVDHRTDRVTFVNRARVVLARVPRPLEESGADDASIPTEHEVEVMLLAGEIVRGVVSYVLPDQARALEFLNLPDPFFRLVVSSEDVLLINKQHVACVALVSR